MPWTAKTFADRHNKSLSKGQAKKAASIANAILRRGGDEGIAIATANKHVETMSGHRGTTHAALRRRARLGKA